MKTSHLILFLLIIYLVLVFYKRREYFSHNSGHVHPGKVKLTLASLSDLLHPKHSVAGSRYQDLYDSGRCTTYYLPPIYAQKGTDQAGNIKYCQCDQSGDSAGGLIPARNMPNSACSKNDLTRGGTT